MTYEIGRYSFMELTKHSVSTSGFFNPEVQKYPWAAFFISMDMGLH